MSLTFWKRRKKLLNVKKRVRMTKQGKWSKMTHQLLLRNWTDLFYQKRRLSFRTPLPPKQCSIGRGAEREYLVVMNYKQKTSNYFKSCFHQNRLFLNFSNYILKNQGIWQIAVCELLWLTLLIKDLGQKAFGKWQSLTMYFLLCISPL